MIRGRSSRIKFKRKAKAKRLIPVLLPERMCPCGDAWDVMFPGTMAFPATTVSEVGMTCVEMPAVAGRETIALCFACAKTRGWPNMPSKTSMNRGILDERAANARQCGDVAGTSD